MVTIYRPLYFKFDPFSSCQPSLFTSPASQIRRRLPYSNLGLKFHYIPDFCSGKFCRFSNFKSQRPITNADLHNSRVVADEEVLENLLAVEPECSAPIVHLKSGILEAESLSLLAEATYVDSLLTTLPVLSGEKQNGLAATPAHPAGLYALYVSFLAGNLVEQLWKFVWPSSIALLHPSLLPVAIIGFFAKLTIIIGGPLLGRLMDNSPRLPAYVSLNVVQAAAQLLSATMIIRAHVISSASSSFFLVRPWFVVLVIAGAIERLCGVATGVAIERDWVVLLAGINRPIALARANAVLNRIDLLCEIAGASVFGILLSKYDPVTCLKFAAGLMIWSLPVIVGLTWFNSNNCTGVLDHSKSSQRCCKESIEGAVADTSTIADTIKLGWKEYMQQPVLPASLAYVLLYFNVVLAPGSLMTAFLTQREVNDPFHKFVLDVSLELLWID